MGRRHLIGMSFAAALLVAACSSMPTAVGPHSTSRSTSHVSDTTPAPAATQSPSGNATSTVLPSQAPTAKSYFGLVLDQAGNPAAGIKIAGYLISNNGGGVVSNNGSGLISNNGGGLVSDKGSSYHLLDTGLTTTTDAQGHFSLTDPQGRPINIEADQSDSSKAIAFNVASDTAGLQLKLAPTGTISGKVTATKTPSVTHFIGVQVFVPGTSYFAATADDGSFTINNVPKGTYALYATKQGLGNATLGGVQVASNQTAPANLDLTVAQPTIASITPAVAVPGGNITITGSNFGASDGSTFSVSIAGAVTSNPDRIDDHTIKVTVPAGATSGDVNVTVNGIQSNAAPIKLATSIALSDQFDGLLVGGKEQLVVTATDANGNNVPIGAGDVNWKSSSAALQVDQNGLVTAVSAGSGTITVGAGSVSDSFQLTAYSAPGAIVTYSSSSGGDGGASGTANVPVAGSGLSGVDALACDANANIYVPYSATPELDRVAPNGVVKTIWNGSSTSNVATTGFGGVAVDASGNVYLSDNLNNRILKVTPAGQRSVFAGPSDSTLASAGNNASGSADGPAGTARFNAPEDLVFDASGKLYVADSGNNAIRVIASDGTVSTLTTSQTLLKPNGLALDPQGNLLVACTGDDTLRRVTPQGTVTQVTTSQGTDPSPIIDSVEDAQGNLYVLCAADATPGDCAQSGNLSRVYTVDAQGKLQVYAGSVYGNADGTPSAATFGNLRRIVLTPNGNLLLADEGNPNGQCTPKLREILLHP